MNPKQALKMRPKTIQNKPKQHKTSQSNSKEDLT